MATPDGHQTPLIQTIHCDTDSKHNRHDSTTCIKSCSPTPTRPTKDSIHAAEEFVELLHVTDDEDLPSGNDDRVGVCVAVDTTNVVTTTNKITRSTQTDKTPRGMASPIKNPQPHHHYHHNHTNNSNGISKNNNNSDTSTLRSNYSEISSRTSASYTSNTSTCPAYDQNSCISSALCLDSADNMALCSNRVVAAPHGHTDDEDVIQEAKDGVMRYSFKGYPPELYSPKKEFIYTRPLVEKQLVLKKTCEWWFYKSKCNNMSTHWKQNSLIFLIPLILVLLGLIIFLTMSTGDTSKSPATELPPTNTLHFDHILIPTDIINTSYISDGDLSTEEKIENDIDDMNNSISDDFTTDYVTPIKVDNATLNDDDLLYESKRNNNNKKDYFHSAFSVTGTFHSTSSQVWDPHPEYKLNVFGHQLHLVLHQDSSFIPPKTFRVIKILNNRTEEEDEKEGYYLRCYYKGHIQGDDQSAVAVSLCNGMTGYIKTSFGTLLIQPLNQTADENNMLHKVWRHSRRNARHAVTGVLDMDLEVLEQSLFSKLQRQKRNYVDRHLFTMEVLVAVDSTMSNFHKEDLKSYILTLISIVSNIFSDASIGNSIYISVAHILILHDEHTNARTNKRRTSASQSLKHFCSFVSKQAYHYDTAMLITRDQICHNERETKCDTLGLAELGTVCRKHSCSIVQDNGLPAAFTIAHELGHILNMPHDDDDRCKQFNKPGAKRKLHIMSSIMGDDIHPWSWSDCSRYYVSEFLEKEDKTCLEDTPTVYIENHNTKLPGEIYSLDHQCQLIHGNQSRYCHIEGDCKRLWCKTSKDHLDCRSTNLPWADGTPCRHNRNWCQKGECVPRDGGSLQLVHGGWGGWSAFTPCSLTCGGGVQESQRECNNPLPKNGGKYCAGSRKKYRSCNTQSCPPGSLDSREQQCYDMNGRNFGIKGIDRSAKWIPKYGLSSKDKCKLYCRLEDNSAYFRLSEKVKDGTTCSFDSFDKCVNGICRPAGCDNELNSIAKLDKCGVCEGRNDTCEEYTGNFYVSDLYKIQPKTKSYYYYVANIPKGASNIVITQPGYHDENYIVLRDDQRNSLLNGNKLISTYRNISFYAGVTFEYNGSNSTIERVNTTYSRKLKRDLIVEIISLSTNAAKNNDSLLLTYTYTTDKQYYTDPEVEIYQWDMQPWSNCDALCHGSSHSLPVCVSPIKGLKMAPQFCNPSEKPQTKFRACNTDCVLSLNVSSISDCSASCGLSGTREKTYHCIQTFPDIGRSNIVDLSFCVSKFEFSRHEQCREGCWDYTEWSPCSKSCGFGTQTRGVACFLNRTRVSDTLCNPRRKDLKDTLKTCNVETCRSYYSEDTTKTSRSVINWISNDWGQCDDNCEKNRTVVCRSPQGYGCPADKKPISKRKCCNIKYVSNWSNCSVQCGNGVRRKELHCARVYKPEIKGTPRRRVFIDPSYCRHMRKPTPKRMEKPCKVSCKWSWSDWTQCQADCSEEYQSRSVYCESVVGNPIEYKFCDAARKPPTKKICNNCVRREIKDSACNSEGYRRRRYFCYDSTRRRISCPTDEKIFKEKCLPRSCDDIRRFHKTTEDRDYTIYINSKPKKIYCHNMGGTPKEYISVNQVENFSIYYDYMSRNPDKCPPESRNYEYPGNNMNSGRTVFRKVRVDIKEMKVVVNDYTFADTVGKPQPYGSAGDCYNRNMECPQGDFSINLDRTGFYIRPGTTWDRYGNMVAMAFSNSFETSPTTRRASCGGYCGGCAISHRSGLYLDV